MKVSDIFFNNAGRLRSGWRLAIYFLLFIIVLSLIETAIYVVARRIGPPAQEFLASNWGQVVQALILFASGLLVGWGCGALLEGLPFRALGWATHSGWLGDWLTGSIVGAGSLLVAAIFVTLGGGFRFAFNAQAMFTAVGATLLVSGLVFIIAAAAEEVVFRGYPLQTTTRAHLAWVGLIVTSLPFAWVHLNNPNVVPGFTFVNTMLAGVWLGVAYLRTRSLWFPLGIHWSWNWMMGAVLGLPVSGIERLAPAPLLHASDAGPAWLTGGAYGIEGGAACTLTLVLSTIFIWRTRLVSATDEMMQLTNQENPKAVTSAEQKQF